ncbi:MAG: hypothetical protein JW915_13130 [Chitinispirillaceae bacterium]|nr:hypothetical protein [Chitinispirillaceae bacterium]
MIRTFRQRQILWVDASMIVHHSHALATELENKLRSRFGDLTIATVHNELLELN